MAEPKIKQKEIAATLKFLCEVDIEELVARPALGDLNFKTGRKFFEKIKELANKWSAVSLGEVPVDVLDAVMMNFTSLKERVEETAKFTITSDRPEQARDNVLGQIQRSYADAYSAMFRLFPLVAQLNVEEANEILAETHATHKLINACLEETRTFSEKTIQAVREMSKDVGIQELSRHFQVLTEEIEKKDRGWERITWGLGILTTLIISLLLVPGASVFIPAPEGAITDAENIFMLISRILIISIPAAATRWAAGKNCAYSHQASTSRHMTAALRTCNVLAKGGELPETRDAVLRDVMQFFCSPPSTGFLGKVNEAPAPIPVVGVISKTIQSGGS